MGIRQHRIHLLWILPALALAAAALLVVAPFVLIRSSGVRDWALDRSRTGRFLAGNQRLRIERIVRLDPSGIDFRGVRLETLKPEGWSAWVRVGRLSAQWSARALAARRIDLAAVAVDSVRLDLTQIPDSVLARRGPTGGARRPLPPIRCSSARISDLLLLGPGERRTEGSLALRRFSLEGGKLAFALDGAEARTWPDSVAVRCAGGIVEGDLDPRFQNVRIDSLRISSDGINAGLRNAEWTAIDMGESRGRLLRGDFTLDRLVPLLVPPLRKLGLPLDAGDLLSGTIRVSGRLKPGSPVRGEIAADLSGRLLGSPLDSLVVRGIAFPDSAVLQQVRMQSGRLRVEGNGHWARAGATGEASLRFSGLDLSDRLVSIFAARLPKSDLAGSVAVRADSIGPRIALSADLQLEPGRLLDRRIAGFSAGVRLDPGVLTLDRLATDEAGTPALTASGTLLRANGAIDVEGSLAALPLEDWLAPWIDVPMSGATSGRFRLTGSLRKPRLEGDLTLRHGRVVEVTVDTLHAGPFAGPLRPLALRGPVTARGIDIYKIPLDSLSGEVGVERTISARALCFRDTMRVDLAGRVVPLGHGNVSIFVDSLRGRAGRGPEASLAQPARLDVSSREVRLDTVRVRSSAGALAGSGWILPQKGRPGTEPFHLRLKGNGVDVGALAEFFGKRAGPTGLGESALDGTGSFTLEGEGTMQAPEFRVRGAVAGAHTFGWSWDRIALSGGAGPDGSARLDSLEAEGGRYVPGDGSYAGPRRQPVRVRADSVAVRTGLGWKEAARSLSESVRNLLDRAQIAGRIAIDRIPAEPFLDPIVTPRLEGPRTILAETKNPLLQKIRVVEPGKADAPPDSGGVHGIFAIAARIGGTGSAPIVDATVRGDSLRIGRAEADSLVLRASYADSLLTLNTLEWMIGGVRSHAQGTVPLCLALDPKRVRLLPRPVHLTAEIPSLDLALTTLVTNTLQNPTGTVSGTIEIAGVPPHLYPMGDLLVRDGGFRIPNREERFTQVAGSVHLDSLGAHIENATARLNETGRVSARGLYHDTKHFSFDAQVRNARVFETGNYEFLADADLKAAPVRDADTLRPQVTGEVRVLSGLISQDLAKPPPTGKPPFTPWLVDIHALAPENFRLNQPLAQVDLGDADLRIAFRWPYWNFGGNLTVLGGTYRIANHQFQITSGTVTFTDTGTGPRATLDITAQTQLAWTGAGGAETVEVQCHVVGSPPDPLAVTLTSTNHPEYTELELTQMLSWGQLTSNSLGTFSSADPTRQYLSSELVGQIERQLVGQLPYADRVQLQGEFGGEQPMWINVRPIVMSQWSLNYAQELTAQPGREVALKYRLSNLLFLNAALDRKKGEEGTPVDTYSLDLKVRIEY